MCVYYFRIRRSWNGIRRTDTQNPVSFKNNRSVLDWCSSGPVENSSATQYRRSTRQMNSGQDAKDERDNSFQTARTRRRTTSFALRIHDPYSWPPDKVDVHGVAGTSFNGRQVRRPLLPTDSNHQGSGQEDASYHKKTLAESHDTHSCF